MNRLTVMLVVLVMTSAARADDVTFTVRADQTVGPAFVGFGAQMNPYLYAKPNWGDSGGVTDENVKDLERKVVDLRPQFVRLFMAYEWWKGEKDGVNKLGEPRMRQSFLRTLRLAQRAGATITLTMWWGDPKDPEKTARRTVELLDDILRNEKIDAVKSINLMNEPNGDWPGEEPWTLERYNKLYRALDAELKRAGLRDRLKIITGDLVEEHQPPWMANIAENLAELTDGISIHAYWDYRKTGKLLRRLDETKKMVTTRPSIANKPLFVTEFGAQGAKIRFGGAEPGTHENGMPLARTTTQAMQIGWFMMEAVNRGYVGLVQWDMYEAWYDRLMRYGVIGDVKSGWELKPGYYVLKMFTHTTRPGWKAVQVEGEAKGMLATAMRGEKGEMTLFVLNRNEGAKEARVKGITGERVKTVIWNGDGRGRLSSGEARAVGGELKVFCPGGSIVAVTTMTE